MVYENKRKICQKYEMENGFCTFTVKLSYKWEQKYFYNFASCVHKFMVTN